MNDFNSVQWKATDWMKCFLNCFRSNRMVSVGYYECVRVLWCESCTHVWYCCCWCWKPPLMCCERPNSNKSDILLMLLLFVCFFFLNKISYFINLSKKNALQVLFCLLLCRSQHLAHSVLYWIDSIERNQIWPTNRFRKHDFKKIYEPMILTGHILNAQFFFKTYKSFSHLQCSCWQMRSFMSFPKRGELKSKQKATHRFDAQIYINLNKLYSNMIESLFSRTHMHTRTGNMYKLVKCGEYAFVNT